MSVAPNSLDSIKDFYEVYSQYKGLVRSIIYRIAGESDLDDLVQDSFIKAWRSKQQFRGDSEIKTWICRISTNVAIDYLRRKNVRKGTQSVENLEVYGESAEPTLLQEHIKQALGDLKEEFRVAFILVALNGLTTREASKALQIEEGTVRSRVSRARTSLKETLSKKGVYNES